MGTSQSSGGPAGGVPLVPPWAEQPSASAPTTAGQSATAPDEAPQASTPSLEPSGDGSAAAAQTSKPPSSEPPSAIAPARRFLGARSSLGSFASGGRSEDLRRAVGRYVRSGYGGAATATRRLGSTATAAGALYSALSSSAAGQAVTGTRFDRILLAGKSAQELADALVEAVRPVDGTLDAEAGRQAIKAACSDLLDRFPDADLLALSPEERDFVVERYVAFDVYNRLFLDLGQTILEKAPSATTALARLKEVRDYVRETIARAFRAQRERGGGLGGATVARTVHDALRDALDVFEGYAE